MPYSVRERLIAYNRTKPTELLAAEKLRGVVIHSTDNPGATADNHFNYWNSANRNSSAHYVIDWKEIIRLIPEEEVAWHAGSRTANREWLGVEMCEPANDDPNRAAKFEEVWKRAVWLIADICIRHNWSTGPNVWSHNGLRSLYKGITHTDPYGFFKRYGRRWTDFLAEIDEAINRMKAGEKDEEIDKIDEIDQAGEAEEVNESEETEEVNEPEETEEANEPEEAEEEVNEPEETEEKERTPILAPPSAEPSQAYSWAKNKGASGTFLKLVDLYWALCGERGGINPVAAYAQAAKETAFGRFTGVLDESFCNPCGLKTRNAKGDRPEDHKKFADWREGVTAHLDHLALYAGAEGYPKGDSPDERQFASIAGASPTVEDLNGKWAPDKEYGNSIVKLMNQIQAVPIDNSAINRQEYDNLKRKVGKLEKDLQNEYEKRTSAEAEKETLKAKLSRYQEYFKLQKELRE